MKYLAFIFTVCLFFSCNQDHWKHAETKYNVDNNLKIQIDSIEIALDSISLPEYLSKSAIFENNDSISLYAYNSKTGNIDIFNLNSKCVSGHINLHNEGENAISENITSIQIISKDSIFIYDGLKYVLINDEGSIIWTRNGIFTDENKSLFLESAFFTKLFYDKINSRIYGRHMSTGENYPFPEKQIFSYYDIQKDSLIIMPIYLPEYIRLNGVKLGRNSTLHAFFYHDRICYNFSAFADIFIYDIFSNKLHHHGGSSALVNEKSAMYDGDFNDSEKKWKHFIENTNYNPIIFNPYDSLYYRISFSGFVTDPDYSNLGHFKKNIVVSVFNKSLEIIHEEKLPNYKLNFIDYFQTKDGLLVFGNNPLDENINYEKIIFYKIYATKK